MTPPGISRTSLQSEKLLLRHMFGCDIPFPGQGHACIVWYTSEHWTLQPGLVLFLNSQRWTNKFCLIIQRVTLFSLVQQAQELCAQDTEIPRVFARVRSLGQNITLHPWTSCCMSYRWKKCYCFSLTAAPSVTLVIPILGEARVQA